MTNGNWIKQGKRGLQVVLFFALGFAALSPSHLNTFRFTGGDVSAADPTFFPHIKGDILASLIQYGHPCGPRYFC